ncbi:PhzF family phenazine biosynthesis protein [Streptomyces odontomachi]|uniref:PhzF family phenazine biosynthesis protein n=1 Tax=Streptomyces odontomachi TaxID=2944940 RepID=UPI00210AA069|nr:PhzF family phenazine biosynthesis protein [Streptomyces sp. ODS25]
MSDRTPFFLVDVFSDTPLNGNPLAVVPDADRLPEEVLPRIAREFNQAETTFLLPPTVPGADVRLRSFTAGGVEVFGAGHNALGAWWWLADSGRLGTLAPVEPTLRHQQLGTTVLPVTIAPGTDGRLDVGLRQSPPEYGHEITDTATLAAALGLDVDALGAAGLPVAQTVSTGASHLMVALRSPETVDAARPDAERLRGLLPGVGGQGVYLYAVAGDASGAGAYTRFVNPMAGIVEDPATGSAAGPLACLLHRAGLAGDALTIRQGQALGRPSDIRVTLSDGAPTVTGGACLAASGELVLP